MEKKLVTLIIPCYNEEGSIPFLYPELAKVSAEISEKYDCEFIFVNDGSGDGTLGAITALARQDDRVRYISFSRNFGKEAAMYAGFCNAKGDYVAIMDADLQHPPALLPKMLEILETQDYDSVATRRDNRETESALRASFSRMFYKLINRISDADIMEGAMDYRLMKREMVNAIVRMGEKNRFSKGIFGWVGFRTYWMPCEISDRVAGQSKWSFWKLFKYAIDGIINFSQIPLSIASWLGILCTVISFIMVVFVAVRKMIFGDPVAGWASLVCIVMFIGGIQLFCMGIMGQYLSRVYLEVKNRPIYLVGDSNIPDVK